MNAIRKPPVAVAALIERSGKRLVVDSETEDGVRRRYLTRALEAGGSVAHGVQRHTLEESGRERVR